MADATIADIRKKYPQYSDLSDHQLADNLQSKFYADMPRADFDKKIGITHFSPAERQVADEPMPPEERNRRLMSSYVPGSERIRAATLATIPSTMDPRINEGTWGDRYDRALRIVRHRDDRAQREGRDADSLGARTAGATLAAVGTGGGSLVRSLLSSGASLWQIMKESARIGAGFGAPVALFNSRSETPGGRAGDVLEGTVGGGIVGGAIPLGFAGMGRLRNMTRLPFEGRNGGRAERQQSTVRDWEEALPDATIPPAIVAESPTLSRTSRAMANNSVLGGPVREDVRRGAREVEAGIRRTIGPDDLPDQTEFMRGEQRFLRDKLRGYSRPHAEVDTMDRAALEATASSRRESYPTNYSARYRLAETSPVENAGTAADIRGNFVDRMPARNPSQPTATWELLNQFGLEARQAGQLPGWRSGQFDQNFWKHLESRLGPSLTMDLNREHLRRTGNQANLTIPGLRQQRTNAGRAIEEHESGPAMSTGGVATAPPGNSRDLRRTWGAMTEDLQRFMSEAGPGGPQAGRAFSEVDADYGQDFIRTLREPLRRIMGNNVAPDEGLRRLMRATQRNTYNSEILNAWQRVMLDKGQNQHQLGARMLLTPMLDDGLPGFLRAWDNMHPGARRVLASGNQELFEQLERFSRIARRFEPYQRALQADRGFDLSSTSNLALAGALMHNIPTALAAGGGVHLLSRFMTSPRYLRWLTSAPMYTRGGMDSPAFRDHLNRLHVIAGGDPEIGHAVLQATGQALEGIRPVGAKAAFLGENSATADKEALARAKRMKEEGADPEAIRRETGWFFHTWPAAKGQGAWSYEVDDRQFQQTSPRRGGEDTNFFDHFTHPEVERAYPHIRDTTRYGARPPVGRDGQANLTDEGYEIRLHGRDHGKQLHVPLHELQHIIDIDEGVDVIDQPVNARIEDDPMENRARSVEQRRTFTDEQRRANPPIGRHGPSGRNPPPFPGMMRLGGPTEEESQSPRKSALPRDVQIDQTLGRDILERFLMPARGIAGTIQRTADETPEQFDRLTNYRTGQYDPQAPLDALALSGLAATGSLATGGTSRGAGTLGTFIGRVGAENLAKAGRPTAKHILEGAAALEREGVSIERIQAASRRMIEAQDPRLGTVDKGPDGHWRVEIDDSLASFEGPRGSQPRPLREVMDHDELFAAYPDVGNITVRNRAGGGAKITKASPDAPSRIELGMVDDPRGVMLHELQHEVQFREGFARGGSPQEFIAQRGGDDVAARGDYRRVAGEVEAERVRNRADLSPAERRQTPMRMTAPNIPDTQQVVRRHGRNVAVQEVAPEVLAAVRRLRAQGETFRKIADDKGVTESTVRQWLRESMRGKAEPTGRSKAIVDDIRAGLGDKAVAGKHGVTPVRVQQIRRQFVEAKPSPDTPKVWTPEKRKLLKEMWDDKVQLPEMARRLGMKKRAVDAAIFKLRPELKLGYRKRRPGGGGDVYDTRRTVSFQDWMTKGGAH